MDQTVTQPRSSKTIRSAKVANRRGETRARLLTTGAEMFVDRGLNNVSVEELIDAVGISRATFYGFFANKTELAASVLLPVFDSGLTALADSGFRSPAATTERLIRLYLELWDEHRHALLLTGMVDATLFPYIEDEHRRFGAAMLQELRLIETAGLLRNGSATLSYMVLAKTGIPLLRLYHKQPDFERIFSDSIRALLIKD